MRSLVCRSHDKSARSRFAFSAMPHREGVVLLYARGHCMSLAALREGEWVGRVCLRVRKQARLPVAFVGVLVEQAGGLDYFGAALAA